MGKITAGQRKALEEAGYSVKGNVVKDKKGATVASYNENGGLFSGSAKVRGILKTPDAPAKKEAQAKAPAKVGKRASKPAAKVESSPRPKTRPERKASGTAASDSRRKAETKSRESRSADKGETKGGAAGTAAGAALATAAGAAAARTSRPKANPRIGTKAPLPNPKAGSAPKMKEGFQGKYGGAVGRPSRVGPRGPAIGTNPTRRGIGGGRVFDLDKAKDPLRLS